jgi:cytochrome c biogenesis protein CcdA/thiol-disulfide isomerase/thioredoxin
VEPTLIAVAAVAGVATFLSPCVLPVLPVVAASSATGGRRRPLGIGAGLAVAFTVLTLAASRVLSALDLPADLLRDAAIAALALAGATLLLPAAGALATRLLEPLARLGRRRPRGDGFWSGAGLGAALSLVWTPCAGPVLAAITAIAAQRRVSSELVLITAAYALGASLPIFALALLGNRAAGRLAAVRGAAPALRRGAGVVLLAAAWLFTTGVPTQLAASVPGYVSSLQRIERSRSVLRDLRALTADAGNDPAAVAAGEAPDRLGDYGRAPNFTGISAWLNTPGGRPLTMAGLRGKVVLVDFWTYSCVNCVRTLPYLKAWYARYHRSGLVIVGVHTPEFAFEHVVGNVRAAVAEHGIRYPVAIDDGYATWNAWANQYWPADYLVDRSGRVRVAHFGEGGYAAMETDIRRLLGERPAAAVRPAGAISAASSVATPETYLGYYRAQAYVQPIYEGQPNDYRPVSRRLPANAVELAGHWTVDSQHAVAGSDARLWLRYTAPRIYLVASPPRGNAVRIGIVIDSRRMPGIRIGRDDLYQLAHLAAAGPHLVELSVPPGTELYSFTFG